jgi:hypothetical protein
MSDTLYTYIETTGVIVPDTSTLLTEVQSEFTGSFGAGLNTDSSTPQGKVISAETTARSNLLQNNAALANQINPNFSEGVFLDAVCALTGLLREADTYTVVENVLLQGVPGTPVPAGSAAATEIGDLFTLTAAVELELSSGTGQAFGTFMAVAPGPIPCGEAGAGLVNVETDVLGWETVSNAGAATAIGTLQQNDGPLRILRRKTLALQGVSLMEAILSSINNLNGVIGSQGLENVQSTTQTISTIVMEAKSIWVCVDGGAQADIATVLLQQKSGGCDWNGAQSVSVVEPSSGQTYTVLYDIPTQVPVLAQFIVKQGMYVGNLFTDIPNAAVAFGLNKVDGFTGFVVGESASPFELAAAVQQQCPGIYIRAVNLSLVGGSYAPTELAMAINQKAVFSSGGSIDVEVIT